MEEQNERVDLYTQERLNVALSKVILNLMNEDINKKKDSGDDFMFNMLMSIERTRFAHSLCEELGFKFEPKKVEEN